MEINIKGNWKLLTNTIPTGAEAFGIIRRSPGDEGALVRLQNGNWVQINAGSTRSLDKKVVEEQLYKIFKATIILDDRYGSVKNFAELHGIDKNTFFRQTNKGSGRLEGTTRDLILNYLKSH